MVCKRYSTNKELLNTTNHLSIWCLTGTVSVTSKLWPPIIAAKTTKTLKAACNFWKREWLREISHLTAVQNRQEVDLLLLITSNMFPNRPVQLSNSCLMRMSLPSRTKITAKCSTRNKLSLYACNHKKDSTNLKRKNFHLGKSRSKYRSQNKYLTNRHSLKSKSRKFMNLHLTKATSTILLLMQDLGS